MAWRRNEIAVEWLEFKDKGKINCMSVKHVLGDVSRAVEGTKVVVKFGSRRYRATIIDLLEWHPQKRRRRARTPEQANKPHEAVQRRTKGQRKEDKSF